MLCLCWRDAITKGVFSNVDEALSAMVSTSTVPYHEGVAGLYEIGIYPAGQSGMAKVSSTLEYAYDDWTIYHQTALKAGNKEIADTYRKRALNYRNIHDTNIGFARPATVTAIQKEFDVLQTSTAKALSKVIHGTSPFMYRMMCLYDRPDGRRERHSYRNWTNSSPCICRRSTMNIMRILRKNAWWWIRTWQ